MSGSSRPAWAPIAWGGALALAWGAAFAPWPDDWDGLGFLASIAHFDLASFAPHPPGYPVYVALLKLAARVTSSPIAAARIVAPLSGLVTFAALRRTLPRADLLVALMLVTPLLFRAFSGVGSEAPALACVAVAASGLADSRGAQGERTRGILVGLGVGLGLGVRLSWAPFFLSLLVLLPRPQRLRALLVALLSSLAWGIPFVLAAGPSKLVALERAQLAGHMNRWGGTALTEPVRMRYLARDLLFDGFGGGCDLLGIALLVILAWTLVASVALWLSRTTPDARRIFALRATILVVPYLAWVTFGQNLRQQPRHVLPLVLVAAWALAWTARAAFQCPDRRSLRLAFLLLASLLVARTAIDATARHRIPPPGVQLLAYLRASVKPEATVVYAGASARFLDGTEWQSRAHAVETTPDAWLALTHEDRLPREVLVTNEVAGLALESPPGREVAVLCRPERLDRRLPCLHVYAFDGRDTISR